MKRYGMAWHTVKYWQDRAKDLWFYNGITYVGVIGGSRLDTAKARDIGHDAIAAAFVCQPGQLKTLLEGR